ncbi:MAG: hypothetical protein KAI79_05995 [Bacteroidales bacterium]|nr:hypothetical protein [Bacteroidales bacterium]
MIKEVLEALDSNPIQNPEKFVGKTVYFADESGVHSGTLKDYNTKKNIIKIDTGRGKNRGGDGVEEYTSDMSLFKSTDGARKHRG